MSSFRAACVQLRSSDDVEENVRIASDLICEAKSKGAQFIATPENTTLMAADGGAKLENSYAEEDDPALPRFRVLAEELGVWLLIGSLAVKTSDRKTANRSFLIDPKGTIAARYDKVFLFDVDLPSGETYRESNTVTGGNRAAVADLPWGRVGLSICYDLRFPQLYRRLAQAGSSFLAVPSAFTETTGKAHWDVLLRARAIESGAFVIAPAQGGMHANGRQTYGHSMLVGPWGEVLAEAGTEPCVISADIDTDAVGIARQRVPSLRHDRKFDGP
ncbi:MAG: carbon-nitrogen hydrolase family protein [Rhizomicrobium sp.]|jgi:predicted amidohydrolase